jgi:hypothetical protein
MLVVTRHGFELAARITIRDGCLQLAYLHIQKFVRHDQHRDGLPGVATASRDCLIGCRCQPVGFWRWLAIGIGWHRLLAGGSPG